MIALSKLAWVWAGFTSGCALTVAGVFLVAGLGVALIAGGVIVAGSFLLLADTEGKPSPDPDEETSP